MLLKKIIIYSILIIFLILLYKKLFANCEKFSNMNQLISINDIPSNGDELFNKCIEKVTKNNFIKKIDLVKCSHKYCANMRSKSLDGGSITTNLIPLDDFENKGPTKNFYISVCCTSDYCRMIYEKSHKYIKVKNNYFLVKTNNNYGNKIVQILYEEHEDVIENGLHLTGLSGNLSLERIKEICNY